MRKIIILWGIVLIMSTVIVLMRSLWPTKTQEAQAQPLCVEYRLGECDGTGCPIFCGGGFAEIPGTMQESGLGCGGAYGTEPCRIALCWRSIPC